MSLNSTPAAERVQIGIFGRVNAGKSSLMNALTGQDMAVVSDRAGTTTDPVTKAMELLPIGPVQLYDTPGLLDDDEIGDKRIARTELVGRKVDMAILVLDASVDLTFDGLEPEKELISGWKEDRIPYIIVANKSDNLDEARKLGIEAILTIMLDTPADRIEFFTSIDGEGGYSDAALIRDSLGALWQKEGSSIRKEKYLVSDLADPGDTVILVIPIDESAPKGRIILPQQQVLRDLLDHHIKAVCLQPEDLAEEIKSMTVMPKLVITDSQAFEEVSKVVPESIPLTSFSMLMARYKGDLEGQARGAKAIDELKEYSSILISEGCTHHRQCQDIGTVKIPGWIAQYTGKDFEYYFTSGGEFPEDLSGFDLIIHCGGCTLPPKEMSYRIRAAKDAGVPMTNYGTLIAYLNGILDRAIKPLEIAT